MLAIAAVTVGARVDDDADGGSQRGGSINVAIVDNPNMQDLARLTPSLFTAKSHIKVKYTILDVADALARRHQLALGAPGERLDTHLGEHLCAVRSRARASTRRRSRRSHSP